MFGKAHKQISLLGVMGILGLCMGLFSFIAQTTYAGTFAQASMMPQRAKTSQSNVPILVVIQPSSDSTSGVEDTLRITFSPKFSVSGTASALTTSISGLPSTYNGNALVAMPGIGATASSVSGQTVNFSISNLTAGTQYGFYVSSGVSTTIAGNYTSTLYTRDGSGIIDEQSVGVSIKTYDQLTVTATIPASASDGEVSVSSNVVEGSTLVPSDTLMVTLSYRSDLNTAQRMELVGSWDEGLIVGSGSMYVEALEYVAGTAENAYGATEPVIDTVNRTITWDISSLPPSISPYTVSFQLRVRSDISTSQLLSTQVHVNATLISTPLAQDDWDLYIQKPDDIVPTSTPKPTSRPSSSSSSSSQTPTPTPVLQPVSQPQSSRNTVNIDAVSADDAIITITTPTASRMKLFYGTSAKDLSHSLESSSTGLIHVFHIENLDPDTQYFFRFIVYDRLKQSKIILRSDVYTFRTALRDALSDITSSSILWDTLALNSVDEAQVGNYDTFVTTGSPITIRLHVDKPELVKKMTAKIVPLLDEKNVNVLGITSGEIYIPDMQSQLVELVPGIFSGTLAAPKKPGKYRVEVKIHTIYGGFSLEKLPGTMYVSKPITILSTSSKPVEGATVTLYRYNDITRLYERIDVAIPLEYKTDQLGFLRINLPYGTYKARVRAPGYKDQEHIFTLSADFPDYPTIRLQPSGGVMVVLSTLGYSWRESLYFLGVVLDGLAESSLAMQMLISIMILCTLLNLLRCIDIDGIHLLQTLFKRSSRFSHVEGFALWMIHIAHFILNAVFGTFFLIYMFARLSQSPLPENSLLIGAYCGFLLSWISYLFILWRDYERFQFGSKGRL